MKLASNYECESIIIFALNITPAEESLIDFMPWALTWIWQS